MTLTSTEMTPAKHKLCRWQRGAMVNDWKTYLPQYHDEFQQRIDDGRRQVAEMKMATATTSTLTSGGSAAN
jgi:hypothetical protein